MILCNSCKKKCKDKADLVRCAKYKRNSKSPRVNIVKLIVNLWEEKNDDITEAELIAVFRESLNGGQHE